MECIQCREALAFQYLGLPPDLSIDKLISLRQCQTARNPSACNVIWIQAILIAQTVDVTSATEPFSIICRITENARVSNQMRGCVWSSNGLLYTQVSR